MSIHAFQQKSGSCAWPFSQRDLASGRHHSGDYKPPCRNSVAASCDPSASREPLCHARETGYQISRRSIFAGLIQQIAQCIYHILHTSYNRPHPPDGHSPGIAKVVRHCFLKVLSTCRITLDFSVFDSEHHLAYPSTART
jgi:hypothetical protein